MRTADWWSLVARNGFRISPRRLHLLLGVSFFTPLNDFLGLGQHLVHGRAIERTQLPADPIFILGHWRSGTTLMHELMVLDDQFASPSTYACFAPWHFLLTERLMFKFGGALLPDKRPMDNMKAGWQLPQEDEFALMILGAPTPYSRIAFPHSEPPHMNFFDMQDMDPRELKAWERSLTWFIKALTYHHGKQLIMKSPPHTGRLGTLLKLYPNARFVHMVRDPRKLFASTLRLWKSLEEVQALQIRESDEDLKPYIWECLDRMYASFERDRPQVDSSRIIDVQYEALAKDPIGTVEQVYRHLGLDGFEQARPRLEQRTTVQADYQVNQHAIDAALEAEILERWRPNAERYGYC
ncbi:MAG: sulfotransferase [Pirellulales bacterium]